VAIKPFVRTSTLQQSQSIVDKGGHPVAWFVRLVNDNNANVVRAINQIAQIPAIQAALVALTTATQAAQEAAEAAQAAADSAMSGNAEAVREQALVSSGIMPRTVVAATALGDISIAAHTRYYGDGTTVAVDAGGLSGYLPADQVYVSYVDSDRLGGAVTYEGFAAFQSQTGDRHVVGSVVIPATGLQTGEPGPAPPGG